MPALFTKGLFLHSWSSVCSGDGEHVGRCLPGEGEATVLCDTDSHTLRLFLGESQK